MSATHDFSSRVNVHKTISKLMRVNATNSDILEGTAFLVWLLSTYY